MPDVVTVACKPTDFVMDPCTLNSNVSLIPCRTKENGLWTPRSHIPPFVERVCFQELLPWFVRRRCLCFIYHLKKNAELKRFVICIIMAKRIVTHRRKKVCQRAYSFICSYRVWYQNEQLKQWQVILLVIKWLINSVKLGSCVTGYAC